MSRTYSFLSQDDLFTFHASTHLFETNKLATQHNNQMLKFLNVPIAPSNVEQRKNDVPSTFEDEKLDPKVLLYPGQKLMLTSNLWIEYNLVNGSLSQIITIFYKENHKLPQLSTFMVVRFSKYIWPSMGSQQSYICSNSTYIKGDLYLYPT
jgi:hypothetical protein